MQNSDLSIFRDSVDGKQKYCRILIRRKRSSVEQALEFFGRYIQDLDEIAAEAGDEDKAEIRAMQACFVTAMDALRAQQELKSNLKALESNKPQTNADRIRAMSDEELAVWLCGLFSVLTCYTHCPECDFCNDADGESNGLKKWLQQTAEE